MSLLRRPEVVIYLTSLIGGIVLLEYYIEIPALKTTSGTLQNWATAVGMFALLLGTVNLFIRNINTIRKRESGRWLYSIVLVILLIFVPSIGLAYDTTSPVFQWFYNNWYVTTGAGVNCLFAIFLAYACFRSFRFKNIEATFLLISGIIVLMGYVPIGELISKNIPLVSDWIIKVPNTGTMRGIAIGAGIGTVMIAIRQFLGLERRHLEAKVSGGEE